MAFQIIYMYIYIYTLVYLHYYISIFIYPYLYIYIYICIFLYIYLYIYIYIHLAQECSGGPWEFQYNNCGVGTELSLNHLSPRGLVGYIRCGARECSGGPGVTMVHASELRSIQTRKLRPGKAN